MEILQEINHNIFDIDPSRLGEAKQEAINLVAELSVQKPIADDEDELIIEDSEISKDRGFNDQIILEDIENEEETPNSSHH